MDTSDPPSVLPQIFTEESRAVCWKAREIFYSKGGKSLKGSKPWHRKQGEWREKTNPSAVSEEEFIAVAGLSECRGEGAFHCHQGFWHH